LAFTPALASIFADQQWASAPSWGPHLVRFLVLTLRVGTMLKQRVG
jgi:hypothetical protein